MIRVLLVEDNRGDARLFAELLSEVPGRPFELTTVERLADATSMVASHDVVFLDLSLPDAHGLPTLTAMVAAGRATPIVVLTGTDDERTAVDAVKAGAQDYLRKAEITPALIARTAWYAIERKRAEEHAHRLAVLDEATRRARLLSSVSAAIASSFELESTLPAVATLLVPEVGDYCVIDLMRDGLVERIAGVGFDERTNALMSVAREYSPGPKHPRSIALTAIEKREIVRIGFPELTTLAPDQRSRDTITALGVTEMLVVPMIARDRVLGALGFAVGPSGRTFDSELTQLASDLADRIALGIDNARLYAAAQHAVRARDELIAVISHDLRNPLGVIGLALQMIEQDPESLSSALPRAQRAADRMQRLIDDLMDIARIESGALSVDLKPVDLAGILDDTFEQHRVLAASKQITLVRDHEDSVGTAIADRHRLGQALSNLLGNALKFTPAGGTIRLGAERRGDRIAISVTDSGPGIAHEHLPHIFDRYWQRDRGKDGVGLGLAIVKGIVDAHGGNLEVESQLGEGATFRIALATSAQDAAALASQTIH